jgi:broad specificity phosphatase PhoE
VSGPVTTVFLVRHAAHDRLDRILCGRMPEVSLGATGQGQAESLARRLARERIGAVFASPLDRARETAAPIAARHGLDVEIAPGVNEIDCGEWTGARFEDLHADERWHVWNRERAISAPPGGEPMRDVQARALAQLEDWRGRFPDQAIVAVSHSDVIKAVVCGFLGLSLDRYHAFEIGPASITTLVVWEGGGKVLSLNEAVEAPR